jgi:hypothetical protein
MTTPYEGAATAAQLATLQVFHELTSHAEGRQKWLTAPPGLKEQVFNESRSRELSEASYTALPPKVRALLESLSESELALLSDINAIYVGSRVTYPNVPMMAH